MNTKVKYLGYEMKNPVVPASGTFGFGYEFAEYYDINVLGSMSLKGTTLQARYGNPLPRIAECTAGLINAIGLQNPGVDKVVGEEIPKLSEVYDGKVIANVGGHSFDEYVETVARFNDCDKVFAIELNISCPNVKGGGMAFGTDPKIAQSLVYEVKKRAKKPIVVKLSPNVTSIADMAKAVRDGGADGISLINTLVGMRIDLRTRKPIISVRTGGFSGPAVFPVAVRMVNEVARAVELPIMGIGGVSSARDVIEMMMAGATCVQVGAANLVNPFACKEIVEDLPNVMAEFGITNLEEIIGAAK
ncbi:MAG: dihydroorotate dehydrogenase [Acutalibacteraceae bacterium]